MSGARRIRLRITGRVQGVFYRASARTAATRLGLRGWVRNLPDGTVEAVAQGGEAALESFVDWCHRGSPGARVERVEVWDAGDEQEPGAGFDVRF